MPANKFAFLCAGASIGGALAILLTPKPGAQTRRSLRALGQRGLELVENRSDIFEAGRKRVTDAIDVGRQTYRESASQVHDTGPASAGALGFVALEAAAIVAGFALAFEIKKNLHTVMPKVERLLDASRTAVEEGSREIFSVASKAGRIMGALESRVGNR